MYTKIKIIINILIVLTIVVAIGCSKSSGKKNTSFLLALLSNPKSDLTLTGIELTQGTLSPVFDEDVTDYTVEIEYDITSIAVIPHTAADKHVITVNSVAVESGDESDQIALNVGANEILIYVSEEGGSPTKGYRVVVNRLSGPSHNANLAGLSASVGLLSPVFNTNVTSYNVDVANSVTSIRLRPTAAGLNAQITVNALSVPSGEESAPVSLTVGDNVISVIVTAQDGIAQKTYTITVTRLKSNNADLAGLTVSAGSLSPGFNKDFKSYTVEVSFYTTSIAVTPTLADLTATLSINGTPGVSGFPSGDIDLNVGSNPIVIEITAEDGVTVNTYTVNVIRKQEPGHNANLLALSMSAGTLAPIFNENNQPYTSQVTYYTTAIQVRPTTADSKASVRVNGTLVVSGSYSGSINLIVGENDPISIEVTAEDGFTTKTYTITVTRLPEPNHIADLSNLTVSGGPLSPLFNTSDTVYKIWLRSISTMTVTPTLADLKASVTVNGQTVASGTPSGSISLHYGDNNIAIVVAAEDGFTLKTYTVHAYRLIDLPKTGQTISYLSGDDGDLQLGAAWPTPRFINHGDGTITDELTGLMWTKNSLGSVSWHYAFEKVRTVNATTGTGIYQYHDWRVPNITELISLLNFGDANPASWLNAQGFQEFIWVLWSSNRTESVLYATGLSFSDAGEEDGYIYIHDMPASYFVHAVRTSTTTSGVIALHKTGETISYEDDDDGESQIGVAWPSPRFTANGDDTFTDNLTGLMWMQPYGTTVTWSGAFGYINSLNAGSGTKGHTDWRLPNIHEYRTLLKRGTGNGEDWLNAQGFNHSSMGIFWSSTTSGVDVNYAWCFYSTGRKTQANYGAKTSTYNVWAVRTQY